MSNYKKLLYLLIWLGIVIELVFRVAYKNDMQIFRSNMVWENDYELGYLPKADSEIKFHYNNLAMVKSVNPYGFYDLDMKLSRPKGNYRIAFIGNFNKSEYQITNKHLYPEGLKKLMFNNCKSVDWLNFLIDGEERDYNKLNLVESKILAFNPDMIILNIDMPVKWKHSAKDFYKGFEIEYEIYNQYSEAETKKQVDTLDSMKAAKFLYDISYLFRGISKWKIRNSDATEELEINIWKQLEIYSTGKVVADNIKCEEFTIPESAEMINDIYFKLREWNIKFCLLDNITLDRTLLNEEIGIITLESLPDKSNEIAKEFYNVLIENYIPSEFCN